MPEQSIREKLADAYGEDMLFMDGYDDCIAGVVSRCGNPTIVCYDFDMVIKKLMAEDDMTEEDAMEWYSYNMLGSGMGDMTPCFIELLEDIPCLT